MLHGKLRERRKLRERLVEYDTNETLTLINVSGNQGIPGYTTQTLKTIIGLTLALELP